MKELSALEQILVIRIELLEVIYMLLRTCLNKFLSINNKDSAGYRRLTRTEQEYDHWNYILLVDMGRTHRYPLLCLAPCK